MKSWGVIIYGAYLLVLIVLLIVRIIGWMSIDLLNIIYLIVAGVALAIYCSGYRGFVFRHIKTIESQLDIRDDSILIKEALLMLTPLLVLFIINYLIN
ncbi:MAG: hypothetical protein ACLRT4_11425 [Thomasclavelia sp.]